ncbi:phosphatidylinositol-glycan biosynthesis class f protein-related [Citrus sinensis]|uniref:Phosphatidylinositol-glycan biosynthesis class f protein-related n=1 Tax=Citrus sinensis TaxID=2711 RepID=A0ACB8JG74_CITSI|nr:phosphatidylinositol-glycan biosynthesis class f protein-related [Citrus sinensis]
MPNVGLDNNLYENIVETIVRSVRNELENFKNQIKAEMTENMKLRHMIAMDDIRNPKKVKLESIEGDDDGINQLEVTMCPLVILFYSCFRKNPEKCSYLKAVIRGVLALPIGALVNALGAIALGAPVGIQYFPKTVNWSLLMSLFTFVPAASVFGSSWEDWRRIFAHTKPNASVDYMICLPAHGAVIGAWFGAWPMPLDWERPWQEWPICVSYGAMAGYLITMVLSFVLVLPRGRQQHPKAD